eukprot:2565144-Rhodomonas_salina.1
MPATLLDSQEPVKSFKVTRPTPGCSSLTQLSYSSRKIKNSECENASESCDHVEHAVPVQTFPGPSLPCAPLRRVPRVDVSCYFSCQTGPCVSKLLSESSPAKMHSALTRHMIEKKAHSPDA